MAPDITRYDVCVVPLAVVTDGRGGAGWANRTGHPGQPSPCCPWSSTALSTRGPRPVLQDFVRLRSTKPALFPVVEQVGRVVAPDPVGVVYLELPPSVWGVPRRAAALAASTPPPRARSWGGRGGGGVGGGAADQPPRPPPCRCHVRFVLGAHLDVMDAMHAAVAGVRVGLWRQLDPAAVDAVAADTEWPPLAPGAGGRGTS